jgi:hypothetical protein
MLDGGHSHACGIHPANKRFEVRKNFSGKFGGDLRGALGARIHDADKFRTGKFAVHARMIPPEISGAYNRNADIVWAGSK